MFIPFSQISDSARIWIYQSDRKFTGDETLKIEHEGKNFIETWTAHNNKLLASFDVLNDLFIIIAVDESVNDASGCSIDKSIHFLQDIEHEFGVHLFDRMQVAYTTDSGIHTCLLNELHARFRKGEIDEYTLVYNNLVQTKADMKKNFMVPYRESWHYKMVENPVDVKAEE
jgi:hypothetical protein